MYDIKHYYYTFATEMVWIRVTVILKGYAEKKMYALQFKEGNLLKCILTAANFFKLNEADNCY